MSKINENKQLQPIRLNGRINFIYSGENARLAFTLTNSISHADGIFLTLYDALYLNKTANCLFQKRFNERFRHEKFRYIDFVDDKDINALYKKFRQSQALKDLGIKVELADNPDYFTIFFDYAKTSYFKDCVEVATGDDKEFIDRVLGHENTPPIWNLDETLPLLMLVIKEVLISYFLMHQIKDLLKTV